MFKKFLKIDHIAHSSEHKVQKDWLYEEPFRCELNKRIISAKEEIAANKLIEWKPKRKNRM